MYIWATCTFLYCIHTWSPREPEEGVDPLEPGDTDGCELRGGCWESNPGPLEEQPVLWPAKQSP